MGHSYTSININSECKEISYRGPLAASGVDMYVDANVPSAGLIVGDVILSINDKLLQTINLVQWRQEWASGRVVKIKVIRGGAELELPVHAQYRAEVESALSSIQSFQCEGDNGELVEVDLRRIDENSVYVRIGPRGWQKITKTTDGGFRIGIFSNVVQLVSQPITPEVSPHVSDQAREGGFRGPLFIAGHGGLGGSSALLINLALELESGLGFQSDNGFSLRATGLLGGTVLFGLGAAVSGEYGGRLAFDFPVNRKLMLGLFGEYRRMAIEGTGGDQTFQYDAAGGGLELVDWDNDRPEMILRLRYNQTLNDVDNFGSIILSVGAGWIGP